MQKTSVSAGQEIRVGNESSLDAIGAKYPSGVVSCPADPHKSTWSSQYVLIIVTSGMELIIIIIIDYYYF
jgi:hypothetical protein